MDSRQEEQLEMGYGFTCPECEHTWESEQCNPTREWCSCGTAEIPETIEQ